MTSSDLFLVDIHSHFLPALDDGAEDEGVSYEMLTHPSCAQYVAATPHFYGDSSPAVFLENRKAAFEKIKKTEKKICFGAEVYFYPSMGRSEALREFCFSSSSLVLIEMPFERWKTSEIQALIDVRDNLGLRPVLAHAERYIPYQKRGTIESLSENGVLIQNNAGYFLQDFRAAYGMLSSGLTSFLGSDMHNTRNRKPDFMEVINLLTEKKGASCLEYVSENCRRLISEIEWI